MLMLNTDEHNAIYPIKLESRRLKHVERIKLAVSDNEHLLSFDGISRNVR